MSAAPSWDPERLPTQPGKTFVVTGGNRGIGYFISEQLASTGAKVIIASRSKEGADAAAASIRSRIPGAELGFVRLDLASPAAIREAADELNALGTIDLLINNAGLASGPNERRITVDGLELVVGTNAFGPFALTAQVFPSLAADARVVSLGSMATRLVKADLHNLQSERGKYKFFTAYAYSKHAVHAFAFELHRRLAAAGSGVESLLAHPGFAQDGLGARRPGINTPLPPLKRLGDALSGIMAHGKDRGAWPVVRAALDPAAKGGEFYGPRRSVTGGPVVVRPVVQSAAPDFGAEFWRQAHEVTGIRFEL